MLKSSDKNLSQALHNKFCLFKEVPDEVLKTAMATITMSRTSNDGCKPTDEIEEVINIEAKL